MVIGVANAAEADRVFADLAVGDEVLVSLRTTHRSPRYGVVRDPFETRWAIDRDGEAEARGRLQVACYHGVSLSASPSSRGPGRGPFKAKTRVRIPLGTLTQRPKSSC